MVNKKLQKLFAELISQQNLWFLFFIGFFILCSRFFTLDHSPELINQDDLNNIYDAWSFSQTGSDRNSTSSPFYLHGLGNEDQRPSLQAWVLSPLFVYSYFGIEKARLFAAFISLFSALLFYFAIYFQYGIRFANISLFLLSVCPWFYNYMGLTHEGANIHIFSAALLLFSLSWASAKKWFFPISALCGAALGIATNAYQASKLWAFLIFLFCLIYLIITKKSYKKILIFILTTIIFTSAQFYLLINNPTSFFSRASAQSIPFALNWNYFSDLFNNFINNLDPNYLIFTSYNNLSTARLGWFLFFFSLAGCVIFFIKEPLKIKLFIGFIFMAFLMPSILTYNNPHALRSAPLIFIYIFWSSYFLNFLINIPFKYSRFILIFSIFAGIFSFSTWYFSDIKKELNKKDMMTETVHSVKTFKDLALPLFSDTSKKIFYETEAFEIDLYFATFLPIHPNEFKLMSKNYERSNWDRCLHLSNLHFLSRKEINLIDRDSLSQKEIYFYGDTIPARFQLLKEKNGLFLSILKD